jgi:predicted PurR-regulated permease PerM
LAWGILIVGTIDNFMRPKLIERGTHIHPFFILMSVLGGLEFFGAVGFLLGPILLSLMFALLDIYKKEFKKEVEEIHQH